MAQQVEKIYSLKTQGFDAIMSELDQLSKKFVEIKKAKQDAAKAAADTAKLQGVESQAYRDAAKALDEQKIKELELKTAIKEKTNEAKAAQLVRQEELNQQKASLSGNAAEVNSIKAVRAARSELNAAIIATRVGAPVDFRGLVLPYEQANAILKQLTDQSNAYTRQFAKDGTLVGEYTSGIIQAFKRLGLDDLVTGQVTKASERLQGLNSEFEVLKQELSSIRVNGQGSFEGIEKQLIDNRKEALALQQQIGTLQTELRGTGDIGNQITTGLANGFKNMKGQLGQFLLSYVGFQAAFQAIVSGVDTAKELSDSTTNLEIELGKTAGGADKLVASLSKLNTRTPLTDLENIANIAAKAGVNEDKLLGVTEALDKIKVAFGSDFGNVESGTESIVKLLNVFEGTDQVTGDNILKAGNAVRTLANETVASVPFLNDFSTRMAGLKGTFDFTLPAVLGLGSGFEQFGQSAEVAGTALQKVIPKIATDVEKYAKIAGITKTALSDLLNNNPAEAFLKVSEGLVKDKASVEEFSSAFKDSELGSGRIAAIIGVAGSKADDFRKAITTAGVAYQDTTNIQSAFAAKTENLAGTLDKIKNAFITAANSDAFKATLNGIAAVLLTITQVITAIPFGIVLGGLGLLTAAWAFYKGNLIAATLAQSANNEATLLGSVRLGIMRSGLVGAAAAEKARAIAAQTAATQKIASLEAEIVAERASLATMQAQVVAEGEQAVALEAEIAARRAKIIALEADVIATRSATVATEGLNIATKASPLGIILTLLAIAIPALTAFGNSNSEAATKVKGLNDSLKIQGDIESQMREQTTKTKNSVNELISVIKTEVTNQNLRQKAYEELIKIAPEFKGTLDDEYNATDRLNKVYDTYIAQLDKVARAQAIRTVKQKIENDKAEAQNKEFQAKIAADDEAAQNKTIDAQNKKIAQEGLSGNNLGAAGAAFAQIKKVQTDKQKAYKDAQAEAKKANEAAVAFDKFMKGANEDDKKALIEGIGGTKPADAPVSTDISNLGVDELKKMLEAVKNQISQIDQVRNKSESQINQLKLLRKQRNEIIAQIKELGGSLSIPKASAISAQDKDLLSIEDTKRDLLLTLEKKTRVTNQEDEETYLKNVLKINQDSIDKKISLIKGNGIAEQKLRAQLNLDRITEEQETAAKIQEIHNKEFTEKQTVLKNQLDADIAAIKEANDIIQNEPDALPSTKAQARVNADNQILALVQKYNNNIDLLEKQLNANTVKNSKDLVNLQVSTKKDSLAAVKDLDVSILADIDKSTENAIAKIKLRYDKLREDILTSKASQASKNANLQTVDNAESLDIGSTILNSSVKKKAAAQTLFDAGLITADQFEAIFNAANTAQKNLNDTIDKTKQKYTDLKSLISGKLTNFFNFDVNTDAGKAKAQLLADTLSNAYGTAKTAMDNYYSAEDSQIERSRSINEKALQLQFDQLKAKAQSQAEQASLDKQFQAAKDRNDREAFEKNKKIQREQAKINLAVQLSNLAVIAFSPNPANIATLGIAGTIMYAIQAALAIANYALNVGRINSAQFAQGGEVPKRGGKFGGKQHSQGGTKFNYQNEQFEAEVDELAIIRTRNAPARNKVFQIMGTHQQIASQLNVLGGGIEFAPGAKLKRFAEGGFLGSSLQAPVFVASSNSSTGNSTNGISKDQFDTLISRIDTMNAETSKRIDRMQVVQVTSSVTKAQAKQVQQRAIGTIG